ncbi:hypothetical protein [Bacillus sp. 1P02SD]|uniref:hypothetical protein n=1 Tax=Bacillus sp. 1P02SD TaxID=3132264 RepID=UPI00399F09D5
MSWMYFVSGGISFMFAYFLFTGERENDADDSEENDDIEVNDHKTRRVELSCQTCRKLKWHREIETYLFECMKCKRRVDLRKKVS